MIGLMRSGEKKRDDWTVYPNDSVNSRGLLGLN
jgi:hypothetical protein